ncbi:Protein LOW PSII ACCUMULATION 3 chloroplastic, partial [Zea mays]
MSQRGETGSGDRRPHRRRPRDQGVHRCHCRHPPRPHAWECASRRRHAIRFNRLRQPLHAAGGGEMKWGLAAVMASTTTVARDFSGDKCRRSEETAGYKDLQLQLPSKTDLQPPATLMAVMPSRETDNIAEHGHNAAKHVASLISVDTPKVGPDIQQHTTKKSSIITDKKAMKKLFVSQLECKDTPDEPRSARRVNPRVAEKEIVVVLSFASVALVESSVAVVDHLTFLVSHLPPLQNLTAASSSSLQDPIMEEGARTEEVPVQRCALPNAPDTVFISINGCIQHWFKALLLALQKIKVSQEQKKICIATTEPLLMFALSCGMYSSPKVSCQSILGFDFSDDNEVLHNRLPGVDTDRQESDEPPSVYIFINSSMCHLASIEKYVENFATFVPVLLFNLELDTFQYVSYIPNHCLFMRQWLMQFTIQFYRGLMGFPQKVCTTGFFLSSSQYFISDDMTITRSYHKLLEYICSTFFCSLVCLWGKDTNFVELVGFAMQFIFIYTKELLRVIGLQEEGSSLEFLRRGYK